MTLTYGRDAEGNESHERAAILTYSDCQKFFKNMRKRGLKFRYLIVGEVGSKKGRTHWHVIVFFEHTLPTSFMDYGMNSWHRERRKEPVSVPMRYNVRYNNPLWPHGFSQWDPLHYGHEKGGVRYACKYINEDVDDDASQSKLCMSKNPLLGAVYFDKRAKKMVDEGVSPQDAFYTFPNQARRKNGDIVRFQLAGRSLELFIENYIRRWEGYPPYLYEGPPSMHRAKHWPYSQMIEDYLDKKTRQEWDRETHELVERIRPARRWPFDPPKGFQDRDIEWGEHGPFVKKESQRLYYGPNKEGKNAWQKSIPTSVWTASRTPRKKPYVEPLTPYQHLLRFEHQIEWLPPSNALGRWKVAKIQPVNGKIAKPVWLHSLMR